MGDLHGHADYSSLRVLCTTTVGLVHTFLLREQERNESFDH